jgi:ABC-type uncharacterized transport system substrate-binding protein
VDLLFVTTNVPSEFEDAFAKIACEKADAVIVGQAAVLQANSQPLAALAAHYKLPAVYASRISVMNGGLMSYGTYYPEAYRIMGNYVGRILNGEKPSDLPVQQLTRVELVINLKTAKALGLELPASERPTSAWGPSRHFAAARQLGRFRCEAEIKGQGGSASLVANDPNADSAGASCRGDPSRIGMQLQRSRSFPGTARMT